MQGAARRMQVLIDDLLSYSRAGTAEKKFENISLLALVEQVQEDLKEELLQKQATVEVSGKCDAYVIPFQFRQLLYNLLSNSIKFSDDARLPKILIQAERIKRSQLGSLADKKYKTYCHIRVADNGIGFEQEYSTKIFEVFQRLHGKHTYEGTGIGLAIVKKIVENHEGIITVESEPGKGTKFDIYIPAR
jgi:signal transduction histidine kinase